MGFGSWLDNRTGYRTWFTRRLRSPLPDGASWIRALVFSLVILFLFEGLTGFLLSLTYSPSVDHAHASVRYTMEETEIGALVRSLHFHGASLVLVFVVLTGLICFYKGACSKGNEISWVLGIVLINLLFGYTITGFLLTWDQNAYWGTKVRMSIMGSTPVAGPMVQEVVQGGAAIGNLTLTRFYSAHFFLLPLLTIGVYALYRAIKNHQWRSRLESVTDRSSLPSYWPHQASRDFLAGGVTVVVLFAMAVFYPIGLGPEADPLSNYPARPEWFFRWLFQLLKYFEGSYQIVGTLIIPGAIGTFLLLVPFLDRSKDSGFANRKVLTLIFIAVGLTWGGLTGIAFWHDIESGHFEEVKLWEVEPDPDFDVETYYKDKCYECHGRDGAGFLESTPDFSSPDYWSSVRADVRLIKAILEGVPNEKIPEEDRMPGFSEEIDAAQAKALIEFKLRPFLEE